MTNWIYHCQQLGIVLFDNAFVIYIQHLNPSSNKTKASYRRTFSGNSDHEGSAVLHDGVVARIEEDARDVVNFFGGFSLNGLLLVNDLDDGLWHEGVEINNVTQVGVAGEFTLPWKLKLKRQSNI